MIKFFRHIRKNLLNEGKTSKYLKYAIGEIILVVIGMHYRSTIGMRQESNELKKLKFLKTLNLILQILYLNLKKIMPLKNVSFLLVLLSMKLYIPNEIHTQKNNWTV